MSEQVLIEPIRLGLMPPLPGMVALYGPEIECAARIACQEINARGGVLGRSLELIVEYDGSLPETVVPAAKRMFNEHHCASIIGNLLSNSRIAVAAQIFEPARIPYLKFPFYEGHTYNRFFSLCGAAQSADRQDDSLYVAEHVGPKIFSPETTTSGRAVPSTRPRAA